MHRCMLMGRAHTSGHRQVFVRGCVSGLNKRAGLILWANSNWVAEWHRVLFAKLVGVLILGLGNVLAVARLFLLVITR